MKNLKDIKSKLKQTLETLDNRWKLLSLEQQHKYLWTFFLGYSLLSVLVFIKIGYDVYTSNQRMQIEHITNPLLKNEVNTSQIDSIPSNLKIYHHER